MAEVRALQLQLQELHGSLLEAHKLRKQQAALCEELQGESHLVAWLVCAGPSHTTNICSVLSTLARWCGQVEPHTSLVASDTTGVVLPDMPAHTADVELGAGMLS